MESSQEDQRKSPVQDIFLGILVHRMLLQNVGLGGDNMIVFRSSNYIDLFLPLQKSRANGKGLSGLRIWQFSAKYEDLAQLITHLTVTKGH